MAIIYSYPKVTSPLATDVLVLTDTTLTAGKRKNKTKSLAMSDLAAYVVSSTSGITGGGTFNKIPLWTPDGLKLGDSIVSQSSGGQGVTVTGQLDVAQDFNVTGDAILATVEVTGLTQLNGTLTVEEVATFNDEVECNNNVTVQGVFAADGDSVFSGGVTINEQLFDGDGSVGTAGQVLSSTGTQTEWTSGAAGGVTGTGTTNTLPIFTDGPGGVLGDSIMFQTNAKNVQVGDNPGLLSTNINSEFITSEVVAATLGSFTNITSGQAGAVTIRGNAIIGDASTDILQITSKVSDYTGTSSTTAGEVLVSTASGQLEWGDPSAAITKLIPYFQTATPGGSDTYTQSNNIVDFDWSGGSGTYEYILPSATAIPYRTIRFVNNSTITASDKIHITAPGTETIDGGAFYVINKPYNGCAVWSDGVQWIVIQAKG